MTVLVLGAGVIGVTTAYYLARAGHRVVVVERRSGPALETSFANGGQISACHAQPWAGPDTLRHAAKWLGRRDAPLKFRLQADPALLSWCLGFLANCTAGRAATNAGRMLRLALYSRDELARLRLDSGIEYDRLDRGILHIYRDRNELATAEKRVRAMNDLGLERHRLDIDACVELEPALRPAAGKGLVCGGIFTPGDESGDAHAFSVGLARLAAGMGVEFHYDRPIGRLIVEDGKFVGVETPRGAIEAEACVVALGSYSPLPLRPLGIRLPVCPAKGYSVTLKLKDGAKAPTVSLIQDELRLVYSRLGERLRVAGMAEIAGYDTAIDERRARLTLNAALALFPDGCDPDGAEFWTGLRAKTPDSVPVLGRTAIGGLYLNTGHGTLGWTMACGAARVLADLVSGNDPEIDLEGLEIDRFSRT